MVIPYSYLYNSTLKNGLTHYYKLDGNSNDTFNTLNASGATITYSAANGKIVQGAGFGGVSSQITFPTRPIVLTNSDYSISIWCKWSALNNALSYNENFNNTVVIGIGLRALNGTIRAVGFTNSGDGEYSADSLITPTLGQWYHIVLTHKTDATATNRVLKCYVDGVLKAQASPTSGTVPGNGNSFLLGRTSTTFFSGAMDELGIWNRVITDNEVLELYNTGIGKQYPF